MRKSLEVIVEACMVQERVDLDRQRTASHHLHYFLVCLRCTNQFFEHNWKELAHFVVFAPVPARGNKKSIVFVAICFCFHVVMNADPSPIITAWKVQKLNQILLKTFNHIHSRRKYFSRGEIVDFFQGQPKRLFPRSKVVKLHFTHSKTKKQLSLLKI